MGTSRVVVSSSPDYATEALRGLPGAKQVSALGEGVQLVDVPSDFTRWATRLLADRPVFVRHVFPLHAQVELAGFRDAVASALDRFEPGRSFAAQINLLDAISGGRHELRAAAHEVVTEALGLEVTISAPEQVLSVVVANGIAYLGVSPTELNLSSWPGGMRRFRREPGQVTRSEFKLLEALEAFDVTVAPGMHALDLGAAPGGWARVLATRGADVAAVDPAKLDARVTALPNVTHHRIHVEDLGTVRPLPTFSFVANDMRMDARESAASLAAITDHLAASGEGVTTLKLPRSKPSGILRAALAILRDAFDVRSVRHLFHNRHEVTAHLTW